MKMSAEQEKLLAIFLAIPPIHPVELANRWPLNRKDLILICNGSQSTVEHWFSAESKRKPKKHHKKLCGILNFLFTYQAELLPILVTLSEFDLDN